MRMQTRLEESPIFMGPTICDKSLRWFEKSMELQPSETFSSPQLESLEISIGLVEV